MQFNYLLFLLFGNVHKNTPPVFLSLFLVQLLGLSSKSVEKGVLFLSAKDLLNDGTINYTQNVKYISEQDYERLSTKSSPQKGDIIYSRIGACLNCTPCQGHFYLFILGNVCLSTLQLTIPSNG